MAQTLRNCRTPAAVLLLLCAVPICAEAQQFICHPIARGDTALRLARQLTGDASVAYTRAFQVFDPARRQFIPKSQYPRLNTEWRACIAKTALKSTPPPVETTAASSVPLNVPEDPAITSRPLANGSVPMKIARADAWPFDNGFDVRVAIGVLLSLLFSAGVAGSLAPRPIPPVMQRAGDRFVAAFTRPLVDASTGMPPIHTRLRFVPRKQQLEIAIAPGPGRRYPNLGDHKRNVEYDVTRVMRLLGTRFVVSDRLRSAGRWVVVSIRLADSRQTGEQ